MYDASVENGDPTVPIYQTLNDQQATEATMIARIAHTSLGNVALNSLRMSNSSAISCRDIPAIPCFAAEQEVSYA
jgi:hypothetical protein